MKKYEMKKMTDFESAKYQGFTLQKGFWYGKNLRGQAVATSTWTCRGCVAILHKKESGWKMEWHDIDAEYLPADFVEEVKNDIGDEEL